LCRHFCWSYIEFSTVSLRQPQWLCDLSRGSAATCLLGIWVRIPPGAWTIYLVTLERFQVEVSASGWSVVQRSPAERAVSLCDLKASIIWRPWPTRDCCTTEKISCLERNSSNTRCTKRL
jgi:hypothetical protein